MLVPDRLRGALIPAVPVPFDAHGEIDASAQDHYARWMSRQSVEGVAVWAHTGRGLRLTEAQRASVLACWRKALDPSRLIIAAAGAPHDLNRMDQLIITAQDMASQAFTGGADALLVHPPVALRKHSDHERMVLEYHAKISEVGLPLILFWLYEQAGGLCYSPHLLQQLLALPGVIGIKVATLDSVMMFQDIAALMAACAPEKVLITGEDRFLGYSLMCGAEAALIGMGAACTALQARLLGTYRQGRADEFLALSRRVDDLARHTFRTPMEGYIRRMLWCLVHQGVIPASAANDPWGPKLDPAEFDDIRECLRRVAPDELRSIRP